MALALFVIRHAGARRRQWRGLSARAAAFPQRDRCDDRLVGCAGGVGGFYLASSLGLAKQYTGSPQWGFLIFAGLAFAALASLTLVKQRWRMTWGATLTGARI
jgi:NNP family nitrate/nitrite transporter-like MFS transporter